MTRRVHPPPNVRTRELTQPAIVQSREQGRMNKNQGWWALALLLYLAGCPTRTIYYDAGTDRGEMDGRGMYDGGGRGGAAGTGMVGRDGPGEPADWPEPAARPQSPGRTVAAAGAKRGARAARPEEEWQARGWPALARRAAEGARREDLWPAPEGRPRLADLAAARTKDATRARARMDAAPAPAFARSTRTNPARCAETAVPSARLVLGEVPATRQRAFALGAAPRSARSPKPSLASPALGMTRSAHIWPSEPVRCW